MHRALALGIVSHVLATSASLAAAPFFMGLGDLPGGGFNSTANGVSGDGSVVVGQGTVDASFANRAFRWTLSDRTMIDLGDLPGGTSETNARGVSADGSVIVGDASATGGYFAFRWTDPNTPGGGGSGMVSIGDLPGGDAFALGTATNSDGSVVVGHSSSAAAGSLGAEAYRWAAPGPMVGLGDLAGGSFFSVSTGVSADGSAVCGYSSNGASGPASSVATRWTSKDGLVSIGDLPGGGVGANAFGISADGNVIVGISAGTGGVYAFRWTNPETGGDGMVSIDDLPGGSEFSRANGVSGDGNTVVGQSVTDLGMEAFVWFNPDAGGTSEGGGKGMFNVRELMTDLGADLTGWTLEVATAISADGLTIVGYGPNPEGNYEAWIAHLGSPGIPEDLDGDGDVDGSDLAMLLGAWGRCPKPGAPGSCPADLDGNGIVDGFDLALLLAAWT